MDSTNSRNTSQCVDNFDTNSDILMLDIDTHSDREHIKYTNSDTLMLDIDTHSDREHINKTKTNKYLDVRHRQT